MSEETLEVFDEMVRNLERLCKHLKMKDYPNMEGIYTAYESALNWGVQEGVIKLEKSDKGVDTYEILEDTPAGRQGASAARRLEFIGANLTLASVARRYIKTISRQSHQPQIKAIRTAIAMPQQQTEKEHSTITSLNISEDQLASIMEQVTKDDKGN